jgi:hypothetical protein
MRLLCLIQLLFSAKCFAQYPFEKLPGLKHKVIPFKIVRTNDSTEIGIAQYKGYKFKLTEDDFDTGSHIWLYFKNKLVKKITGVFYINHAALSDTIKLYVADINGDGLTDFKINYYNGSGAGLGSSRVANIYFFNKGNNRFTTISFGDFQSSGNQEYDFNHDGNCEIVVQNLVYYRGHNYWLFDLYNFIGNSWLTLAKLIIIQLPCLTWRRKLSNPPIKFHNSNCASFL